MKKILLFFVLIVLFIPTKGQYQIGIIPRSSPDKGAIQKIGYTEIEIRYGSPSVRERKIWGGLVPYGEIWRAGANSATTMKFSSSVRIAEMELDSGKYSFFILPREEGKWTIIFNRKSKQWGAFRYDESEDALRVDLIPVKSAIYNEQLHYNIEQVSFEKGTISLAWESLVLKIPIETNYLAEFESKIEIKAEAQDPFIRWVVYLQGAEHLNNIGKGSDLAFSWINQAEEIMNSTKTWNAEFYPREYVEAHLYWTKAKIVASRNEYAQAIKYVNLMKALEDTSFYKRKNEIERIDEELKAWKKK